MNKWNIYAKDSDGIWDIVRVVESANKPPTKRHERAVKVRTITWNDSDYDPRLAFPAAYGLSKRKGI